MRTRTVNSLLLIGVSLGIMGATHREAGTMSSVLGELPLLRNVGAEPGALEASLFHSLGIPRRWSAAHLVSLVESWVAAEGLARCGHPEAHEMVSTPCTLAPGGVLDGLLERVLQGWYESRLVDAPQAVLLYGGLPGFLEATHRLEGELLKVQMVRITPADLEEERSRLLELGVSGASRWANVDVARSLRRRRAEEVDLVALRQRLDPQGLDMRRTLLEGLIRPLALYLGETGTGGAPVREFLEEFGDQTPAPGPLLAPDAPRVAEAPVPVVEPPPPPQITQPVSTRPRTEPSPELRAEESPPPATTTGFAVAYGGTRFAGRR